jgi:diguanylate cyclase (GGDEF)-like protein/PAS domain S-box-containing protein
MVTGIGRKSDMAHTGTAAFRRSDGMAEGRGRRGLTAGGRSIRTKMTAAMLVAALAPLAILGFVSDAKQESLAIERAFERLEGIAAAQVGQLDAVVNADREIAEVLVTQNAIRDGLTDEMSGDVEPALVAAVTEIERLQSVAVIDVEDWVIAGSDAAAVDRVNAIRDRLLTDGQFEGVVAEGAGGAPVVMSATPVIVDGERVGCVVIETSIDTISALATNYEGLSDTGETSVAQRHGSGGAEFIAPLRFKDGAVLDMVVPPTAAQAPITLALAGHSGRFDGVPDYRQQSVLAVTRTVEGSGWGVVVKIDRSEALAGVSSFRTTLLGATLVAALLVTAMAVMFARWISRPIQRLTEAAIDVVDGDLDARPDIRTRDEIGSLASAVSAMTDTLVRANAVEAMRISELETVNARLEVSDARTRSIVDNAADGIVTCSDDGIIESANPATEAILDLSLKDIEGRSFGAHFGLSTPDDETLPERVNLLEWIWRRDEEVVGLYARRGSGEKVPVRISVSRVHREGECSFHAIVRDVSESVDFERRLWESAHFDALTGLPNRELFLSELDNVLASGDGSAAGPPAVLFIDLDRFKVVNDAWGHAAGDELLELVASRLRNAVREDDLLARFGGDEFVVMARSEGTVRELVGLGRRIIRQLERPFRLGDHVTYVGASVGLAIAGDGEVNANDLVSHADVAMYAAKSNGRGRVAVFDAAMREKVRTRHLLHIELREAIDNGDLCVHYQPIVKLESGEFEGAEALVRWDHPTRGLLAPGEFIPVAEETGLIADVGRTVLREVARQIAEWNSREGGAPRVAVNLSAREVMDPTIVDTVLDTLAASGASPSSLTIEVTESVLVTDAQAAIDNLTRLRRAGVLIALDDFGTGYSSLTYLRDMPVDIVKIDRRFVEELSNGNAEASIAAMILGLGRTMGLTVIAEGVETAEQHEQLLSVGGTYAQGYLYARPNPASEVSDLLWPGDRTLDISFIERSRPIGARLGHDRPHDRTGRDTHPAPSGPGVRRVGRRDADG